MTGPVWQCVGDPQETDFTDTLERAQQAARDYGELVERVVLWPDGSANIHLIGGYLVQTSPDGQRFDWPQPHVPWWLRLRVALRNRRSFR